MPKRLADTGLWKKGWFRRLSAAEKCAFEYIKNNCDPVGVWDVDTDVAEFVIGEKVDWEALPAKLNGNIEVVEKEKWWVVDFCKFQYGGKIDPESKSKVYKNLYRILTDRCLWERYLATLGSEVGDESDVDIDTDIGAEVDIESGATSAPEVQVIVKEKGILKGESEGKEKVADDVFLTPSELEKLKTEFGEDVVKAKIDDLSDALGNRIPKNRYKSHYKTLRNWIRRDLARSPPGTSDPPKKTAAEWRPTERKCPKCGESIAADMICDSCGWGKN